MTTTLAPFGKMTLNVAFKPTASGVRTGSIKITSNDPASPYVLGLSGTGKDASVVTNISYLSAIGSTLYDAKGTGVPTYLKSISWYGMEAGSVPMLLWVQPWKTITTSDGVTHIGIMDQVKALGFDSMRIPLCEDITWEGTKIQAPNTIDGNLNPDFLKTPAAVGNTDNMITNIEILDKIIAYAAELGLRIILDMHCLAPNSDNAAGTLGKWYTTAKPGDAGQTTGATGELRNEEQWITAWEFLAARYKNNPIVCGFDLVNEPYNCTWDDDPLTGWPAAAERCAERIHAINPDVLIIVEGVTGNVTFPQGEVWGTMWSGNLTGVRTRPVKITNQNKVVYSPHEYNDNGNHDAPPWAYVAGWPDNLSYALGYTWGYIAEQNIAPIWIGEFGGWFVDSNTVGMQWIKALTSYIHTNRLNWSFWAIPGGSSEDTPGVKGLYNADNTGLNTNTVNALSPLLNYVMPALDPVLKDDDSSNLEDENGTEMRDSNG